MILHSRLEMPTNQHSDLIDSVAANSETQEERSERAKRRKSPAFQHFLGVKKTSGNNKKFA